MASRPFKFKQFSIIQEQCAMKVGTDGVLLGAWASVAKATSMLDIGAGTGLIAIMLAQRSHAFVDAIEIDKAAFFEANQNRINCKWAKQIQIHNCALQNYHPNKKYDLIVSNPPFFENSLKAQNIERSTARHTDTLSAEDLFKHSKRLLTTNGKCAIIIPADAFSNYGQIAQNKNLFITNILWLKPTPNKQPKRVLIEFSQKQNNFTEKTIVIEDKGRHQYSDEYKALTKDFYLAF